jgi:hypothetical protein
VKSFLKIRLTLLTTLLILGVIASRLNLNKSPESVALEKVVKPHSLYLQGPLDLNTENVGPHFLGHHIGAITEYVKEANRPREEFESSPEYEKRKAEFLTQPLLGMPLGSYLGFTRNEIDTPLDTVANLFINFVYDADKQAFGVMVKGTEEHQYTDRVSTFMMLMGGDGYGLWYDFQPELGQRGQKFHYLSTLAMPTAKAKEFKPSARAVIVCKLTEPWYRRTTVPVLHKLPLGDHEYEDREVDLLHVKIEQIWIVNGSNGEVVQKIQWAPKS